MNCSRERAGALINPRHTASLSIVQHATHFVWMYPAEITETMDDSVLRDKSKSGQDYSLLVYGGFMYLNSTGGVVGANGVVEVTVND